MVEGVSRLHVCVQPPETLGEVPPLTVPLVTLLRQSVTGTGVTPTSQGILTLIPGNRKEGLRSPRPPVQLLNRRPPFPQVRHTNIEDSRDPGDPVSSSQSTKPRSPGVQVETLDVP